MKRKKFSERSFAKRLKKIYQAKTHKKALTKIHHEEEKHAYHEAVLSWNAEEYIKAEKSFIWFILAGIVVALLLIYGIRDGSWTFSAAVIAAVFAYIVYYRQKPRNIKIVVSKIGIMIGKHKLPYSHMKAFWIIYHPPFIQTLNIRTTDTFGPDITIQLDKQSPAEVREYMVKQIPEWEGKYENFVDSLSRFLKLQ